MNLKEKKQLIEDLKNYAKMPKNFCKKELIKAGIITKSGKLTKPYAN